MKTALTILALLALAGSVTAGTEQFTWVLPPGADASAVKTLMEGSKDLWPEGEDAAAWAKAIQSSRRSGALRSRIDYWLEVPDGADVGVLDEFVAACFHRYRLWRLPVLPALIDLSRMEVRTKEHEAWLIRAEMHGLLVSGAGVIDREKTLAASAGRCEDLHRRIADARIEAAVLEARIRAVRMQVKGRREHLEAMRAERVAAMEADLDRRIERKELSPSNRKQGEHREEIEHFRRQPIPEDDLLASFIRTAADLEVEQIGTEERVKVLARSLEEEKRRSLALLDAKSLEDLRKSRLAPVEKQIRELTAKGDALEKEFTGVRSLEGPRRVTVDPSTGEIPCYYIVGRVNTPGAYLGRENMTLTLLVAMAGDFCEDADKKRIRIVRGEGENRELIRLDFNDVIELKIDNPELRPGDIVSVPEDLDKRDHLPRAAVDPDTGQPQHVFVWGVATGAFVLEEGMTLTRLLKVIGYRRVVDLKNVQIIRKDSDGKEFRVQVDADALNVRNVPKDKDPVLEADDIVILPEKK